MPPTDKTISGSPSDERVQRLLKSVLDHFDKEDRAVRERQIRTWRRLKLFWEGFQKAWYSETAHDWRIWDESTIEGDSDQSYYDKPINVFRAYLESIIAALSIIVPPIKCFPDDADDALDLSTAKAGDKIGKLVGRHNDVSLLWLHSLFIFCTEGMVACHTYPKCDEKYGTYEDKQYEDTEENHQYTTCPSCGFQMNDQLMTPQMMAAQKKLEQEKYKFDPDDEDIQIQDYVQNEDGDKEMCPACMQFIIPQLSQEKLVITKLIGTNQEAKTRIMMDSWGGLYIKVANYARKQCDTPYLIWAYETHFSLAVDHYDHLKGKKYQELKTKIQGTSGPNDPYEQWGRLSPQYQGEYPMNAVTVRNAWLRPAAFNVLDQIDDINYLKEKFPNGAKCVFINDIYAESCNESLDDAWTLLYNPLSDFIHFDPLGLLLVSVQEITNDLISLILQTIEHGIGQTFADPAVLNFNAYRQMESVPGGVYEATPKTGKSIGDAFYEAKTATLSAEVMPFAQNIQSLAQLVSGALPSLFGGAMEGQGETASQYSMSRSQALQRLQNVWKMFTTWWKDIFGKAIPMYIEIAREQGDEREVSVDKSSGNFINTYIRRAELEGKIGKIELEANENLPITWSQRKDILMTLLQANNPEILQILGAPENLPIIREAIGLDDFFVPNEDDVEKQYDEIKQLLNSQPIPTGNPQNPFVDSVGVDQIFDNHGVDFEIIRKWVISEDGRQAKIDNPQGYKNVVLHGIAHKQAMMQQMMQQAAMQAQASPNNKPKQDKKGAPPAKAQTNRQAPVTGEQNVPTIQ